MSLLGQGLVRLGMLSDHCWNVDQHHTPIHTHTHPSTHTHTHAHPPIHTHARTHSHSPELEQGHSSDYGADDDDYCRQEHTALPSRYTYSHNTPPIITHTTAYRSLHTKQWTTQESRSTLHTHSFPLPTSQMPVRCLCTSVVCCPLPSVMV